MPLRTKYDIVRGFSDWVFLVPEFAETLLIHSRKVDGLIIKFISYSRMRGGRLKLPGAWRQSRKSVADCARQLVREILIVLSDSSPLFTECQR
jgi:hypothetical protein